MKLATFEIGSSIGPLQRVGAAADGKIVDLQLAYGRYLRERRGVRRAAELARAIIPDEMVRCGSA